MKIKLVKLRSDNYPLLTEMMDEWSKEEKKKQNPYSIFKNDYKNKELYLNELEVKEDHSFLVEDSTFFLSADDRVFLGAVNIRHRLNEQLFNKGGHIGYGIRPSYRGLGFGKIQLELALKESSRLNLNRVLLCCDENNEFSIRIIVSCGGIRDFDYVENEKVTQRYWIEL